MQANTASIQASILTCSRSSILRIVVQCSILYLLLSFQLPCCITGGIRSYTNQYPDLMFADTLTPAGASEGAYLQVRGGEA